jgi:hypothetical protein
VARNGMRLTCRVRSGNWIVGIEEAGIAVPDASRPMINGCSETRCRATFFAVNNQMP